MFCPSCIKYSIKTGIFVMVDGCKYHLRRDLPTFGMGFDTVLSMESNPALIDDMHVNYGLDYQSLSESYAPFVS